MDLFKDPILSSVCVCMCMCVWLCVICMCEWCVWVCVCEWSVWLYECVCVCKWCVCEWWCVSAMCDVSGVCVWCVCDVCDVCDVMWRDVTWCDVTWRDVTWRDVTWREVRWGEVVWCGVVCCGVVWCDVMWCGVVWCGVVWGGVCVCVCVNHLNRCKTSNLAGVCRECHSSAANEDGYDILWYRSGTLDRRTCFNVHIKFPRWDVANPRTTLPMVSFSNCFKPKHPNSLISLQYLYGFRNLNFRCQ